jgi:hypothetical protein
VLWTLSTRINLFWGEPCPKPTTEYQIQNNPKNYSRLKGGNHTSQRPCGKPPSPGGVPPPPPWRKRILTTHRHRTTRHDSIKDAQCPLYLIAVIHNSLTVCVLRCIVLNDLIIRHKTDLIRPQDTTCRGVRLRVGWSRPTSLVVSRSDSALGVPAWMMIDGAC